MRVYRVDGDEVVEVSEVSDFDRMCSDIGVDAETLARLTDITSDRVPMPDGDWPFEIRPSSIHGQGVFASRIINPWEEIGPVRIGLCRTPLGYLTNHSGTPNAETMGTSDGGGVMIATRHIAPGEEVLIDYRQAVAEAAKAENFGLVSRFGGIVASDGVMDAWQKTLYLLDTGGSREEVRKEIATLEAELLKMPQSEHGLEHFFLEGLYGRAVTIPAGVLFTTPVHKEESVLNLFAGRIVIVTEEGATGFDSGQFIITKPGTKRVVLALEDVKASTIHPNPDNCRDIGTLESRIYAQTFNELEWGVIQ